MRRLSICSPPPPSSTRGVTDGTMVGSTNPAISDPGASTKSASLTGPFYHFFLSPSGTWGVRSLRERRGATPPSNNSPWGASR